MSETVDGTPRLSVVVASVGSRMERHQFLEILDARAVPGLDVEILVVEHEDAVPSETQGAVKIIGSSHRALPELWGQGIAAARGEWIAVLETSCPPAPDWLAVVQARAQGAPAVFGGCVEMAPAHGVVDWSAFFCEYAQFMLPLSSVPVRELPGNNICFHRDLLGIGRRFVEPGFWKTYWTGELMRKGIALEPAPSMIVLFNKHYEWIPFLRRRFCHGRCYAGMRFGRSDGKRVLFALGTLVLPAIMFARLLGKVLSKRRSLGRLLGCLPCCLLAIVAWAVGEAAGYCAGPGKSCGNII